MNDIKGLIRSVFDDGYLMSLATTDKSGPWVSDVIYVHDDHLNLFWISDINTRHSTAISQNQRVAATITITNNNQDKEIGLQLEGLAKKLEGDIPELANKHRVKRGKSAPNTKWEILDEEEAWYKLSPTKIELIYAPKWGFKKQVLKIK